MPCLTAYRISAGTPGGCAPHAPGVDAIDAVGHESVESLHNRRALYREWRRDRPCEATTTYRRRRRQGAKTRQERSCEIRGVPTTPPRPERSKGFFRPPPHPPPSAPSAEPRGGGAPWGRPQPG